MDFVVWLIPPFPFPSITPPPIPVPGPSLAEKLEIAQALFAAVRGMFGG